jgi:hypothetical protein
MVSTWCKRLAREEIYGSLAAKEVPSNKAKRDIWIAPSSRELIISAEAVVIVAKVNQEVRVVAPR